MEDLIALYLFQNKACSLPGVGTLYISSNPAVFHIADKQIYPPASLISFTGTERPADNLKRFIAASAGIDENKSGILLREFCNRILSLGSDEEIIIPGTGKFYKNDAGDLAFMPDGADERIMPVVSAERVIHPDVSHSILVGDIESTSVKMTEFFSDPVEDKKSKWWIWALVLFLISATAILIHYTSGNKFTGNGTKIQPETSAPGYTTPQ